MNSISYQANFAQKELKRTLYTSANFTDKNYLDI